MEDKKIPALNISASQDSTGTVHITLVNINATKSISLRTILPGIKFSTIKGEILTSAKFSDMNTFENPNKIKIVSFAGAKKAGEELAVDLPAQSVVMLELK